MNLFVKLFLRAAIPYGVIMGVAYGLERGWRPGLFGGLLAGLMFGITMSLLLGVLQKLATRKMAGGEDTAPRQSKTVPLGYGESPDDALRKAAAALDRMAAKIDAQTQWGLRASTRWSWKSFGETVTVTIKQAQDNEMVAVITSAPRMASTAIDYGKGKENVELLANAMMALAAPV